MGVRPVPLSWKDSQRAKSESKAITVSKANREDDGNGTASGMQCGLVPDGARPSWCCRNGVQGVFASGTIVGGAPCQDEEGALGCSCVWLIPTWHVGRMDCLS